MTECRFGASQCREGQECARCRNAGAITGEFTTADLTTADLTTADLLTDYIDATAESDDTRERDRVPGAADSREAADAREHDPDADTDVPEDAVVSLELLDDDDIVVIHTVDDIEPETEIEPEIEGDLHVDIDVRFEHASAPAGAEPIVHAVVEMTPHGGGLTNRDVGPVSHVILALDVSASMDDDAKFPVLVEALKRMLYDLQDPDAPDVLVSMVLFAYGAAKLFDAVPARDVDPRGIEEALRASPLIFGRYTDVAGALLRAGRIAYDAHRADRRMPLRIVVLTDGHPQDFAAASDAMALIEKLPVDVDCFAFGDDADVLAMKRLICGRRGGTVKLVQPDTIGDAFARVAEVAQLVVAKRALLNIELSGGVVGGAVYRHRPGRHSFGKAAFVRGTRFATDLGTLQRDRTYSVVIQLRLPWTDGDETEVGSIVLRVPGEGGPRTFERVVSIPRNSGTKPGALDPDVHNAVEIVSGIGDVDVEKVLAALLARRDLLAAEQRSERLLEIVDRAIDRIRMTGSMEGMSNAEVAALASHTRTILHGATK